MDGFVNIASGEELVLHSTNPLPWPFEASCDLDR